jgi:hypothetical protein
LAERPPNARQKQFDRYSLAKSVGQAFGARDVFYQEASDGRPWMMRQRLGRAPPAVNATGGQNA